MNKKDILNNTVINNSTNKLFICTGGKYMGKGETLQLAYENYLEHGSNPFHDCTFFKANEIEVELTIK